MLMDKTEIAQVAIASMNKTHEDEIALINALFELIQKQLAFEPVKDELSPLVERFATHVEHHFANEEQLMSDTGFPAFGVHKGEHDRVRAELAPLIDAWQRDENIEPPADYVKNVHPGWAKTHIATMDTMTAMYIANVKPELG